MAEFFRQNVKLLSDKCFQNQTKWENGDLYMANVDGSPPSFHIVTTNIYLGNRESKYDTSYSTINRI